MSKPTALDILRSLFTALIAAAVFLWPVLFKGSAAPDSVQSVVIYSENFDALPVPQIPVNWTTNSTGAGANFITVTDFRDSVPNAIFAPNTTSTGSSEITSPPLLVTSSRTVLNFRQKYALENTWDGAVLEIKVGTAPFVDILTSGATFIGGGYTSTLNASTNPLGGRLAWSGATQLDFLLTSVQLPSNAFGQTVQFRWRVGSNDSFAATGWWIDSISLQVNPTGANTNAIAIASNGTANPYPSQIAVAGQPGPITGLTVSLENFSHASPDDVDILLVSPSGRKIVLMSDVGGSSPVNGLSITLTDSAANALPDAGPLTSGIFRPTNIDSTDTFPSPAPQGPPTGNALDSFYGSSPNGTWSLYVVDDNGDNAGSIGGGWNLDIRSSVNACIPSLDPTALGVPAGGGTGTFAVNIPAGCGWSVSTVNPFIIIDSPSGNVGAGVVNFTVAPNTGAARTGLITVTDGFNPRTIQIQQGAGCPTSLGSQSLSFQATGGAGNVSVTAGAACSWVAVSNVNWIVVTSPQQTGSGVATINILPNASRNARNAIVTIGARTLNVSQAGVSSAKFDFDGDGKGDISIYRNGVWYLQQSTAGVAITQFGLAADKLVPADYDGDGKTDVAVFRDGAWYVLQSSNGQFFVTQFGLAGDVPLPADYDGDGRAELAVFRTGVWYISNLATNQFSVTNFGLPADKPVPADYDGDGKTDIAVFREGVWYLLRSTQGFGVLQFGIATDKPVPADYDGDGKSELAVYRNGEWHILSNFVTYSVTQFGISTDAPVVADYDGDGKADIAVFRDGIWYILRSSNGQYFAFQFGVLNDRPVPGAFLQ